MRPDRPSLWMYPASAGELQIRQVARPLLTVPSCGVPLGPRTSNWIDLPLTIGSTYCSFPFFVLSQNDLTRGMVAPQAGLGQVTVRAQIQAMTLASVPSSSLAFGYR